VHERLAAVEVLSRPAYTQNHPAVLNAIVTIQQHRTHNAYPIPTAEPPHMLDPARLNGFNVVVQKKDIIVPLTELPECEIVHPGVVKATLIDHRLDPRVTIIDKFNHSTIN